MVVKIISKDTNLDISDEEPVSYVKRLGIGKNDLKQQSDLWKVERYKDFLDMRRKLLANNVNSFLKRE